MFASGNIEGRGETKLTLSRGASHEVFCYTSQRKIEQYMEFAAVSKVHDLIMCEAKVVVSLVSFDTTRSPPIGKCI